MNGPSASEIAREVDRLVIGVHRTVMSVHRSGLGELAQSMGVTQPGVFYDLAEFLAAGACTPEIARRRFCYEPDDVGGALLGELHGRQLIDDRLQPSETLTETIATILRWRADAAESLWGTDLDAVQDGAGEALSHGSGPLIEEFRSLPEPASTRPAHQLHHRLTGLRYARFDAHIEAWEAAGLAAAEMVALSSAVDAGLESPLPENLVARGWLMADGSPTDAGCGARSEIERETDTGFAVVFDSMTDRPGWLDGLRRLPSQAGD